MNGHLQVNCDQWIMWQMVICRHTSPSVHKPVVFPLLQGLHIPSPSLDKHTCKYIIKKCNKLCIYPFVGCLERILILKNIYCNGYSIRVKNTQPFYICKNACHCACQFGTQYKLILNWQMTHWTRVCRKLPRLGW